MGYFDLALSYKWEYDDHFIIDIENIFQANGLTSFVINKNNVFEVTELLKSNNLRFKAYLDRASDEDEDFNEIADILTAKGIYIINHYKYIDDAIDKSIMHIKLQDTEINTPKTIIIPPYDDFPDFKINEKEMEKIGVPFIIKPAYYSGAGHGVEKNACNNEDILNARKINPDDNYLIQERIIPKIIDGKRCWFRLFWAFGDIYITYWDDLTHIYTEIKNTEKAFSYIPVLENIVGRIAGITKLDFFSTEVALTDNGRFYIIDYVNDQCDMRKKSMHHDGVPDAVVDNIIRSMLQSIKTI